MRRYIFGLIVGFAFVISLASPANTVEESCILNVADIKVCGTPLEPLPTVTVSPDPIVIPGPTVTLPPVPGPTVTVTETIRPAPVRVTITPAPVRVTETVTATPKPQPQPPRPTATVTVTETARPQPVGPSIPVPTATETVTVSPEPEPQETGQAVPPSDTVVPSEDDPFFLNLDFDNDGDIELDEAGIGLLSALVIIALILAGMTYAYNLGRKSENRQEVTFLRALLDRAKLTR